MFSKVLAALVARDVEAFVTFIEHLKDRVDVLVVKHAGDVGKIQSYIDGLKAEVEDEIDRLETLFTTEKAALGAEFEVEKAKLTSFLRKEVAAAEDEIAKIKSKISKVQAAATAVANI